MSGYQHVLYFNHRVGKVRTNINMRNPRMLSMDGGNNVKQRTGALPTIQPQATAGAGRTNTGDDIDIQILQQKKQQAEIKRYRTTRCSPVSLLTQFLRFKISNYAMYSPSAAMVTTLLIYIFSYILDVSSFLIFIHCKQLLSLICVGHSRSVTCARITHSLTRRCS